MNTSMNFVTIFHPSGGGKSPQKVRNAPEMSEILVLGPGFKKYPHFSVPPGGAKRVHIEFTLYCVFLVTPCIFTRPLPDPV